MVIIDPYKDIDYDKISAYYYLPESCLENCTIVTEPESDYTFTRPVTRKSIDEYLDQKSDDFDFDIDLLED